MSDPNNNGQLYQFGAKSLYEQRQKGFMPLSEKLKNAESLGIELPFDLCLVRGEVLRDLQARCRQAEFEASLRSRVIGNLMAEMHTEQFNPKKGNKKS